MREARKDVFLSIGSNLGDRVANLSTAIHLLGKDPSRAVVEKVSPFYETSPWGRDAQGDFLNCALQVSTSALPREFLAFLKSIEKGMGRATGERWGERVIDLDIIFFGDMVVNEDGLVIPHPHAHERAFVLAPLSDIAPDFVHPESGATVREMYIANGGDKGVLGKFCMGREPGHDDLSLTVQGVIAKL